MRKITRRNFLIKSTKALSVAGISGYGILIQGCTSRKDFDLIIKDGYVLDGLGKEAFKADVGIKGAYIKTIGKISGSKGKSIINAKNLVVCPGFIDVHNHSDVGLLANPKGESMIRQGVTTMISGNCGSSPFPIAEEVFEEYKQNMEEEVQVELNWNDIKGFLSRLEQKRIGLNYATLVGQGSIRGACVGFNDRPPKQDELEKMKEFVAQNLEDGAVGLSTGLEYAPGSYAQSDEVTELCKVTAQYGGVYATHMRDEGDRLIESLDEAIDVAQKTGVSLQISHFKIAYPSNWDKIDEALKKIEEAREEGIDIFCDRYPYIAGSTGLSVNSVLMQLSRKRNSVPGRKWSFPM